MSKKKSFLLYCDYIDLIKDLSDEERGKLLTAVLGYANTNTEPNFEDRTLSMIFRVWKAQMDRDRVKYDERCKKNSENAKKRHNKKEGQAQANDNKCMQTQANNTDTDTDTDTDDDTVNDTDDDTVNDTDDDTVNDTEINSISSSSSNDVISIFINNYMKHHKEIRDFIHEPLENSVFIRVHDDIHEFIKKYMVSIEELEHQAINFLNDMNRSKENSHIGNFVKEENLCIYCGVSTSESFNDNSVPF